MDGTAIMQGVATGFIAQVFGIDIGIGGYLMVILTATLASVGTAGRSGRLGSLCWPWYCSKLGFPQKGSGWFLA